MKHTKNMTVVPSAEATELTIYAVNTEHLYSRMIVPVVRNLARKYAKGIFDPDKARDAFYSVACEAAKMYCIEFARLEDAPHVFDVTARFTAAAALVDEYMENIENNDL